MSGGRETSLAFGKAVRITSKKAAGPRPSSVALRDFVPPTVARIEKGMGRHTTMHDWS